MPHAAAHPEIARTEGPLASMPAAAGSHSARIFWIDLLRGIAVLAMIAGHSADAFLADEWRSSPAWHVFNAGIGFVAPLFLTLSGISLWLALSRRANNGRFPAGPWRRAAVILALGYWLQVPVLSLRQLVWNQRPHELARLFDSNILHAIALPMLFVLAVLAISRSRAIARIAAATVGVALATAAPVLASLDPMMFPISLQAFLAPQPVSTFPLAPFAAYHLVGFAFAPWFLGAGHRIASGIWVAAIGLVGCAAGYVAGSLLTPMTFEGFWRDSLPHTVFRFGGVLFAVGLARISAITRAGGIGESVGWLGRHALAAYVLHLVLIYGSPMTIGARYGLSEELNRALDPVGTLAAGALVASAVAVALFAWARLRHWQPLFASLVAWGWWLVFAGMFLATP